MARIFISHSSWDNFEALAFRDWLVAEGWAPDDVFLDLHGIGAGARWKEALAKANERCEAVLFLVSPHSLGSTECYVEIRMAEDMGKVILPTILPPRLPDDRIVIEDPRLAIYREYQIVDASPEPREAAFTVEHEGQRRTIAFHAPTLARIKARLDQLGISPNSFSWVPGNLAKATPYPGLAGFSEAEAALFFGRDGDVARGFASLRRLRRTALEGRRGSLLVIQAASGAGKSSFLKAGLWPRLIRDPDFTALGILRPATGILTGETGVGRQLAAFFARHNRPKPAAEIHRQLRAAAPEAQAALAALIAEATEIGRETQRLANPDAPPPTPVLAVDQAEELFAAADAEESQRFLSLIAALLGDGGASAMPSPPLFVWTIRADSMDALLHATTTHGLGAPELFPLPPLPRTSFGEIINGPLAVANRAGMRLSIDPQLTERLIDASEGADALPLLAYTLRQLVEDNRSGSRAKISLDAFEAGGGIGGMLRKRLAAAQHAASAKDTALRALFLPRLTTWDAEANPPGAKRLVADEAELFAGDRADLRSLADALVAERLLTRTGNTAGRITLEVAHEALLRQPPISDWLKEAREFLVWRDGVARARRGFEANTRSHLMGRELEIARGWLDDATSDDIPVLDRAFVEASLAAEERGRNEEALRERQRQASEVAAELAKFGEALAREREAESRRLARRSMFSLLMMVVLAFGMGVAAWYAWQQQLIARTDRDTARVNQSGLLADAAAQRATPQQGGYGTAILLALYGLPDLSFGREGRHLDDRPFVPAAEHSLFTAQQRNREQRVLAGHNDTVINVAFSPDGARIVTVSEDNTARVWDAVTGQSLATLEAYAGGVTRATFSPDRVRLATTGSVDNIVRLWDALTGQPPATLTGHTSRVNSTAFSPDGARVVTASDDRTARVWDAVTGQLLATLARHEGSILSAAFSPNGTRIVTASDDRTARLWDGATGQLLATLAGHTGSVLNAVYSPDGTRLVTVSTDNSARLWNVVIGQPLATLAGHTDIVTSAAFSPDGARLVTTSWDETARLWDAVTGQLLATLAGHTGRVTGAAISPDGTRLVTASWDNTARLWDAATGQLIVTLAGHTRRVNNAVFSPDGARLVTASDDNTARLWDAVAGQPLHSLKGHDEWVNNAAFSPDGARLVTASDDRTAWLWDVASDQPLRTLTGHTEPVKSVAFSPDGARIVTASDDKTARLWNTATGRLLAILAGHESSVLSAVFSPNGIRLVTASDDNTARVWETATGRLLALLAGHDGSIRSVAFNYNGSRLVTASDDRTARLWDSTTGQLLAMLAGHTNRVASAAFSPNGTRVVTASDDRTARVWDTATGRELATLARHEGSVLSAAFSPNGTRIVTASDDMTARLWDAATGQLLATLAGHTGSVLSAIFSPDGTRLVTVSVDKMARLWDTASGQPLATLEGHSNWISSAAFNPNGTRLVTTSNDRTARLWRVFVTTQSIVDHAKRVVPRCLTSSQLAEFYLPSEPMRWCITGPGLEAEPDPAKWQPRWPYHTAAWRDWLVARDRGEKPALPPVQ